MSNSNSNGIQFLVEPEVVLTVEPHHLSQAEARQIRLKILKIKRNARRRKLYAAKKAASLLNGYRVSIQPTVASAKKMAFA